MWVVEATLKAGKRHIYARRTFYLDEDSWAALANEQYDARGQLWRTGYAYLAPAYDALVPVTMTCGPLRPYRRRLLHRPLAGTLGDEAQPAARNRRVLDVGLLGKPRGSVASRDRIPSGERHSPQPPPRSGSSMNEELTRPAVTQQNLLPEGASAWFTSWPAVGSLSGVTPLCLNRSWPWLSVGHPVAGGACAQPAFQPPLALPAVKSPLAVRSAQCGSACRQSAGRRRKPRACRVFRRRRQELGAGRGARQL